jgi:hypothetical protein
LAATGGTASLRLGDVIAADAWPARPGGRARSATSPAR